MIFTIIFTKFFKKKSKVKMEKFQLGKSRFDLSTYLGRFYHNLDLIDPRTLFVSEVSII